MKNSLNPFYSTPTAVLLDTKTGKNILVPGAVPFDSLKSSIDSLLKS